MTRAAFDPQHLDVAAFAAAAGRLSGSWPLTGLARLAEELMLSEGSVEWQVEGRELRSAGLTREIWLDLQASATVALRCQRCLAAVRVPVTVGRSFRFVADEREAQRLDGEIEDDVLVLEPAFDLRALVEDELLLHLPIVPRHDACPEPLPLRDTGEDRQNPFAVLDQLRKSPLDD